MIYLAVLAFGVTLGLPIAVIFASRAQGAATSTALEGISRQPESAAKIQTAMIIGLALIESLVIYALLMFLLLLPKLPGVDVKPDTITVKDAIEASREAPANDNPGVNMGDQ